MTWGTCSCGCSSRETPARSCWCACHKPPAPRRARLRTEAWPGSRLVAVGPVVVVLSREVDADGRRAFNLRVIFQ